MDATAPGRYPSSSVRRFVALLVSLMLLFPAGSVSAQAFFCHMRGQVTAKCCCGEPGSDGEDTPAGPSASQGDCCDSRVLSASADRNSVSPSTDALWVPPSVMLAVLPTVEPAAPLVMRAETAPPRARAPPRPAPAPFFILHRAFLS